MLWNANFMQCEDGAIMIKFLWDGALVSCKLNMTESWGEVLPLLLRERVWRKRRRNRVHCVKINGGKVQWRNGCIRECQDGAEEAAKRDGWSRNGHVCACFTGADSQHGESPGWDRRGSSERMWVIYPSCGSTSASFWTFYLWNLGFTLVMVHLQLRLLWFLTAKMFSKKTGTGKMLNCVCAPTSINDWSVC